MRVTFVRHDDLDHYEQLITPLKDILRWLAVYLAKSKAMRLIYTSVYRPYKDEIARGRSGVHGFHRAADVVIYKDGLEFSQQDYDRMCILLNIIFDYGDGRHKVCVSAPHGTGLHLHIQAKKETHKRNQEET